MDETAVDVGSIQHSGCDAPSGCILLFHMTDRCPIPISPNAVGSFHTRAGTRAAGKTGGGF